MYGNWLFIMPVISDDMWGSALKAVKRRRDCPRQDFRLFAETSIFSMGIPLRLMVVAGDDGIVAHSEIRDLGTDPVSHLAIAGLSNTIVAPSFRNMGIYTQLIKLRNLIIDHTDFGCVAARVKADHEERYIAQYPGFFRVKERDRQGAAWLLRATMDTFVGPSDVESVVNYLEREIKKW